MTLAVQQAARVAMTQQSNAPLACIPVAEAIDQGEAGWCSTPAAAAAAGGLPRQEQNAAAPDPSFSILIPQPGSRGSKRVGCGPKSLLGTCSPAHVASRGPENDG